MNVFTNFFKPAASTQTQQQNQTQQQKQPPQQKQPITDATNNNQQATASGIEAGAANPNGNSQPSTNPLDAFTGMFNTANTEQDKAPSFLLPEDKLAQVASSQNFLQGINPELSQKALTGDANSLMEMMNAVAQNVYKNALAHNSQLSDAFVSSRLEYENKNLSGRVKQELTASELGNNTPGFNHPVVKAQLSKVAQDLARQYPDASPQQIAKQAKDYVLELAKAINPDLGASKQASAESAKDTDWDSYFSQN